MNAEMLCNLCPRSCQVDRTVSRGFCGEYNKVRAARAALHFWEEPCISGSRGSGAVFFCGCQLKCVFCQNAHISRGNYGKELTTDELCNIFFRLEQENAHNINLVTPSHFAPQIAQAINKAKSQGMTLPFIWNSSGYEKVETLRTLEGLVDIYLPDFKYLDDRLAEEYSKAPDYSAVAKSALREMVRQCPKCVYDENGMLKRGTVVRHLVLPGSIINSKAVLKYLYSTYSDDIIISIMSQYTPCKDAVLPHILRRRLTHEEYSSVVDYAVTLGITHAYTQEEEAAQESFIPNFDMTGL